MRSLLIVAIVFLSACVSQPLPEGFKDQDDFDPVTAAKTRISLGLTYLKNGNYTQAKFNLDKALQFAPRLADAHFSMAYYYQQVGEMALADKSYQEAMDRDPKNPDIANSYGAFLCEQGHYNKSKSFFLKAVNASNYVSTAETYENLALCSQSQGQIDDAVEYLNTALNHQPGRAKSLMLLVQLQVEQKKWQEAKQNLRRYERIARVTPETLWMSIKIERALHNTKLVQGYGDMLIRMYPTHPFTLDYVKNRDQYIYSSASTSTSSSDKMQKELKPTLTQPTKQEGVKNSDTAKQGVLVQIPESQPPEPHIPEQVVTEQPLVNSPSVELTNTDDVVESVEQQSIPQQTVSKVDESEQPILAIQADESDSNTEPSSELQVEELVADPELAQSQEQQQVESANDSDDMTSQLADVQDEKPSIYYIVEKGDNLYRISLRYNVKMQRLIEWNQLEDGSPLYVGKKLIVVDPETVE